MASESVYNSFHYIARCHTFSELEQECRIQLDALCVAFNTSRAGTLHYVDVPCTPQTMELADEDKFDFDPLDVTKIWPEDLFPLQPVGRMVLNKNVDNFFAENEQLAFAPGLVVPGLFPGPIVSPA